MFCRNLRLEFCAYFPVVLLSPPRAKQHFFTRPKKTRSSCAIFVPSLINLLDDLISYVCDLGVKNHRRLREKIDVNNGRQFRCDLAVLCVIPYSPPSMLILRVGIKRGREEYLSAKNIFHRKKKSLLLKYGRERAPLEEYN